MLRPPTATSLADLDSPAWLHWLSRINDPHRLLGSDRQAKIDKAMADLAEIGVTDVDLPFTQRTVVGRNPDIGIEVCCEIVAFFLALAALEEALDTTVSDEGVAPSPHEELAKLALPALQIQHIKIHEGEALYGAMSVGPALEELMRAVVCQKHMKNTQVAELTQMLRKYNWCTNQDV